jgi:hypothetical protein
MSLRNSVSYYTYQQEITERMHVYSWNHTRHIWTYTDPYAVSNKQFLNVQTKETNSHGGYRQKLPSRI